LRGSRMSAPYSESTSAGRPIPTEAIAAIKLFAHLLAVADCGVVQAHPWTELSGGCGVEAQQGGILQLAVGVIRAVVAEIDPETLAGEFTALVSGAGADDVELQEAGDH
jgi:hypothetical protein